MDIVSLILGRSERMDEAEERLGEPMEAEAHDLGLHIERCAQRWSLSYRASKNNQAQLGQIRVYLLFVIVYLVASSPPAARMLEKVFG